MTKNLVLICIFAGLTAVLGLIPAIQLPVGAPITAQNLGLMLAGGILGAKRGFLAQGLFLILIAIGLPVLSGGRGGLGIFTGPTVGFLLAWPIAAAFTGYAIEKMWANLNFIKALIPCILFGVLIVYVIGIPVLSIMLGAPLDKVIVGSAAFIPGDILKAVIAAFIIISVKKSYPLINS